MAALASCNPRDKPYAMVHLAGTKLKTTKLSVHENYASDVSATCGILNSTKLPFLKTKNIQIKKSGIKRNYSWTNGRSWLSPSVSVTSLYASSLLIEDHSKRVPTGSETLRNTAKRTVLRQSKSLGHLPLDQPMQKVPVTEIPWYEQEFEFEGPYIDDEEKQILENAQWSKPILISDSSVFSDLDRFRQLFDGRAAEDS
jgi:hypothetical protein